MAATRRRWPMPRPGPAPPSWPTSAPTPRSSTSSSSTTRRARGSPRSCSAPRRAVTTFVAGWHALTAQGARRRPGDASTPLRPMSGVDPVDSSPLRRQNRSAISARDVFAAGSAVNACSRSAPCTHHTTVMGRLDHRHDRRGLKRRDRVARISVASIGGGAGRAAAGALLGLECEVGAGSERRAKSTQQSEYEGHCAPWLS